MILHLGKKKCSPAGSSERIDQVSNRPFALRMGFLTLGFGVFGTVLMFLGDDATVGSRLYTSTPQFKVWATLIIGVLASLPAVWRVGIDLLRQLDLDPHKVLRTWIAPSLGFIALVVTAAVLAGEFARGSGSSLYDGVARIGVIYALAVSATVPAFLVMWECYRQLGDNSWTGMTKLEEKITHLFCFDSACYPL